MASRRLSFLLISPLLTLAVGGWILTTALHQTIGTADETKTLLHQSNFYQAIIPTEVAQVAQDNPSLAKYNLSNSEVEKILSGSIGTTRIENQGDQAVDNIYAWLEGKVSKPQFAIDITPDRQALATRVGDMVYNRASSLPTCTSASQIPDDLATDPFAATCLPPGVSPDMARQLVEGEISTNPSLTNFAPLTQNDITLSDGKPVFQKFASVPKWYQRAQWLPVICAGVALFCILLILLIAGPLRGTRVVGKHFLAVGITLAACAALITWGIDWLYKHYVPQAGNATLNNALMKLTSTFDAAYRNNILRLSAYVAVAGLVLYIGALITGRVGRRKTVRPARPATAPAASIPEAESLASEPRAATFTPAGPPALPKEAAAKPARTTKARKSAAKTALKKKAPARKSPRKKK